MAETGEPTAALITVPAGSVLGDNPDGRLQSAGLHSLIDALPRSSRLIIACNRRYHAIVLQLLPRAAEVVPIEDELDFCGPQTCALRLWTKTASRSWSPRRHLSGLTISRSWNERPRRLEYAFAESQLHSKSGNLLIGEDFILCGSDLGAGDIGQPERDRAVPAVARHRRGVIGIGHFGELDRLGIRSHSRRLSSGGPVARRRSQNRRA